MTLYSGAGLDFEIKDIFSPVIFRSAGGHAAHKQLPGQMLGLVEFKDRQVIFSTESLRTDYTIAQLEEILGVMKHMDKTVWAAVQRTSDADKVAQ